MIQREARGAAFNAPCQGRQRAVFASPRFDCSRCCGTELASGKSLGVAVEYHDVGG